jgi:hypothetical protein
LILVVIYFAAMVGGAIAGLKIIVEGWARKTSSAMFTSLVLLGASIGNFFRLWAASYVLNAPLAPEVAWRSITGMLFEAVPVILFALYAVRIVKGRWLHGQNGSVGEVPEIQGGKS